MRHSPEMVAEARRKADDRADVRVADMRRLGVLGGFDLITCLNDGLNHLLRLDEVRSLRGPPNLAPGGLLVFDVTTLATYREVARCRGRGRERLVRWRGAPAEVAGPGAEAEVVSTSSPARATGCGAISEPPAPPSPAR